MPNPNHHVSSENRVLAVDPTTPEASSVDDFGWLEREKEREQIVEEKGDGCGLAKYTTRGHSRGLRL